MIRDKIKDEAYFRNYLQWQRDTIKEFSDLISKRLTETGVADDDVKRWSLALVDYYKELIYLLYSYGSPKNDILEAYQNYAQKALESASMPNSEGLTYSDVELLSSLAILLDINQDSATFIDTIKNKCTDDEFNCEDIFIQFFFRYMKFGKPMSVDDCKIQDKGYVDLAKVLLAPETEKLELFKEFMQKKWYKANKESPWYDFHKSKEEIYVGYWAFECAAIAKIYGFNIDDIKLLPYLPIDLI